MLRFLIILCLSFWVIRSFSAPLLENDVVPEGGNFVRDQSSELILSPKSMKALELQMQSFAARPVTEREKVPRKWTPWSLNYFNWSTQRWDHTWEGGARLESYNFLGVTYRMDTNSSLSLRPTFRLSGAGRNNFNYYAPPEFNMGDTYLQYINWNLALLPWDVGLIGKFRVYIPTGEGSSRRKMVTSLRSWMQFYKPLNHGFELVWHVRPELYFYSQRGVMNRFRSRVLANRQVRFGSSLELAKKMSPKWGFAASAGFDREFYYDVPSFGIERRTQQTYKFSYNVFMDLSGIWLNMGLLNDFATSGAFREEDNKSFGLFRGRDMKFSIMTYIRI